MSGSVTSRAMLAKLSISLWSGRTTSPEANSLISTTYGSAEARTRVTKALIDDQSLDEVRAVATTARKMFYENTTPWADEGKRALLTKNFATLDQALSRCRANFETAVEAFLQGYPAHVTKAQTDLGTLHVPAEYPDVADVASKFTFDLTYDPITNPNDWRINTLDDDAAARMVAEAEARQTNLLAAAQADAVGRAYKAVTKMAERLAAYTPGEAGGPRLTEAVVRDVADIAAALPGLNIAANPEIDALAAEMAQRLAAIPVNVLRAHEATRESVASEAAAIAEKMKGFMS